MVDGPANDGFYFPRVPGLDSPALQRMWAVLDNKTKPPRSLGRLEELAARFGALRGAALPLRAKTAVVVAASDHGVAEEGVSAYPQAVTEQMLLNFEAGGAAINALCRSVGAELVVVDVGTKRAAPGVSFKEPEPSTIRVATSVNPIRRWAIRAGSANFTTGPALLRNEVEQAVNLGLNLADELDQLGITVVALGEMGIGNTTVAAVLTAVFCRVNLPNERATLVGRGTGIDDAGLARKRDTVERALGLHRPDAEDPWTVMTQLGGLEIALLAGLAIGAASKRMAVVLDGFISTAAALVAQAWCPTVVDYMFASHRSVEPGHRVALQRLGLEPYLDLDLRLGEGSGAALVLPLFTAAANIVNQMATFESAHVSSKTS